MNFQAEQWYNGGFRGRAPKVEYGKAKTGSQFRVRDLWCSVWYTRFIGTERECNDWIKKQHEKEAPMTVNYEVERCKGG